MKQLILAALLLLPVACSSEAPVDAPASGGPTAMVIKRSVHAVECGCAIDGIGKCGNYVSLEGAFVPIAKQGAGAELGVMEWCGEEGHTAEVEGTVEDGQFIASYLKTVAP